MTQAEEKAVTNLQVASTYTVTQGPQATTRTVTHLRQYFQIVNGGDCADASAQSLSQISWIYSTYLRAFFAVNTGGKLVCCSLSRALDFLIRFTDVLTNIAIL